MGNVCTRLRIDLPTSVNVMVFRTEIDYYWNMNMSTRIARCTIFILFVVIVAWCVIFDAITADGVSSVSPLCRFVWIHTVLIAKQFSLKFISIHIFQLRSCSTNFNIFLLFCHEMFELFRRFLVIPKSVLIEFTSSTLT